MRMITSPLQSPHGDGGDGASATLQISFYATPFSTGMLCKLIPNPHIVTASNRFAHWGSENPQQPITEGTHIRVGSRGHLFKLPSFVHWPIASPHLAHHFRKPNVRDRLNVCEGQMYFIYFFRLWPIQCGVSYNSDLRDAQSFG